MALQVIRIPVLSDNYVWLVHEARSGETMVVDPAVAEPVLVEADKQGWTITQIWNTHWHPDHTGGNAAIKAATGCKITGPRAESARIPTLDVQLVEGDTAMLGASIANVIDVPAHTAGHIAFHFAQEKLAFVGDTLFAMGCGRLFEGTAEQMYANMRKLEVLGDDTQVFCAHEYTASNGRYALTAEPDNQAIIDRMAEVNRLRAAGEATVPTTIGLERATNPFMRAATAQILAERRAAKDSFTG